MEVRTTRSTVLFSAEFLLHGFDDPLPAGEYQIERDEEPIGTASFTAYRHMATFIHVPAIAVTSTTRQMVPVDPAELEAALAKDREAA